MADQKPWNTPDWERLDAEKASERNLVCVNLGQSDSKYEVGRQLGQGSFGVVFEATRLSDKAPVAIKFEPRKTSIPQLRDEYRRYSQLKGYSKKPSSQRKNRITNIIDGFPNIYYYGQYRLHNILIMDLLGPSLQDLFDICGQRFTLKTVVMVAKQLLNILATLHDNGLVHRDIKPENFLIARSDMESPNMLFAVDLGLVESYWDARTNQHLPLLDGLNPTGTPRYMSVNTHLGKRQSRRDDLEALGYLIVYFLSGRLPWQGTKGATKRELIKNIEEKKMTTTNLELCKDCPNQISMYLCYVRGLGYDEKPDYNYLSHILTQALAEDGVVEGDKYDWNATPDDDDDDLGASSSIGTHERVIIQGEARDNLEARDQSGRHRPPFDLTMINPEATRHAQGTQLVTRSRKRPREPTIVREDSGLSLTAMALIPFNVFVPLAKVTQERKTARDDALENESPDTNTKQTSYTASVKTYTAIRTCWCMCLLFGVVLLVWLTAESQNIPAYGRLLLKIKSVDKTFDKIVQSIPKAKRITDTMRARGGVIRHLSEASKRTWKVRPMALGEVDEFQAVGQRLVSFLRGLSIIRKPVRSTTEVDLEADIGKATGMSFSYQILKYQMEEGHRQ
ncbi:hypothetical protein BFJ63_vAg16122 [Fusarium oxysporum f. sp. narcissi]|uniref:non-specific serine/threonine protein kinase n=1 Tax=Fusarium oxysporum f. sp. narcissi TaxID=451672 RepID=A0A4Q2V215_FUSOX|nr:hypothetical protein BFJ63_vAg16122 [Fusarium oxysporum f. sp. narcissi]